MIDRARFNLVELGARGDSETRYTTPKPTTWQHACPVARDTFSIELGKTCVECGLGTELSIREDGQKYLDEPVYLKNKPLHREIQPKALVSGVAAALGGAAARPLKLLLPNRFQRHQLRWMTRDANGAVKPR